MKIHRFIHMFPVLWSSLVLSACMDIRAVDKNKNDEEVAEPRPKAQEEVFQPVLRGEARVQALSELHQYQVVIPVNHVPALVIQKKRLDEGAGAQKNVPMLLSLGAQKGLVTDDQIQEGGTYLYGWGRLENGSFQLEGEVQVVIPIDVEIAGEKKPSDPSVKALFDTKSKSRFGRLLFREKSILTIEDQDLILQADEIIAHQAVLRTFAKDSAAANDQAGRSGGKIFLQADRAWGSLEIELRGENGGNGSSWLPDPTMKGATGKKGEAAETFPYTMVCSGGSWGCNNAVKCSKQAGDGAAGEPGQTGRQGRDGQRGGDTAALELRIQDDSQWAWRVIREPGTGGAAGEGGPGGEGGDGGHPGTIAPMFTSTVDCKAARVGPQGPRGPQGARGETGARGERRPVCEWKNGQRLCD